MTSRVDRLGELSMPEARSKRMMLFNVAQIALLSPDLRVLCFV